MESGGNGFGIVAEWGEHEKIAGPNFEAIGALAEAMSQAIADVGDIAKAGMNTRDRYSYATASDVDAAIGAAMSKNGLAFAMSAESVVQHDRQLANSVAIASQVWYRWAILHKSGAILTGRWVSEAVDPGLGDKGLNKCATAAGKYLKLRLFVAATTDEVDSDSGDSHQEVQQGQQPMRNAPQSAQISGAPVAYGAGVEATVRAIQDKAAKLAAEGYTSKNLEGYQKATLGNMIEALLSQGYGRDDAEVGAHAAISVLYGVGHFGELTAPQCSALGRWLQTKTDTGFAMNPHSAKELDTLVKAIEAGVFDQGPKEEPEPIEESTPF